MTDEQLQELVENLNASVRYLADAYMDQSTFSTRLDAQKQYTTSRDALLAEVKRLRELHAQAVRVIRICMAEYREEYGDTGCECVDPDCWIKAANDVLNADA